MADDEPTDARDPDADEMGRRAFLHALGASLALAGVGACGRRSAEELLAYEETPEGVIPGRPLTFATALELDGYATGLLVQSHEGRPIKVEGNPEHPASLGATSVFAQAMVVDLYAPDRPEGFLERDAPRLWEDVFQELVRWGGRSDGGAGLRLLLEPTSSPLLGALLSDLHARFPQARVTFHAPGAPDSLDEAARVAWGAPTELHRELSHADVILSLESDFLGTGPRALRDARQFADRRRVTGPGSPMSRLYVVESRPSVTGSVADHRIRRRSGDVARAGAAVLLALARQGATHTALTDEILDLLARVVRDDDRGWSAEVARDLALHRRTALVLAGDRQPPAVHLLAILCNAALDGLGRTSWISAPVRLEAGDAAQDLGALAHDLHAGLVDTLLVLGGDPSFTTPPALDLGRALAGVKRTLYLGPRRNRTARDCAWFVAMAHPLESWGDARAPDGTVSLQQPLIEPLKGGKTVAEVMAALLGRTGMDARALLADHWQRASGAADFTRFWRQALAQGMISGTVSAEDRALSAARIAPALATLLDHTPSGGPAQTQDAGLELSFHLDDRVHDGRFADNPWLQELPDPITKLTWDNAALLSPATAGQLGVATEDVIELRLRDRRLEIPALIVPGHADGAVSLSLGHGQRFGGEVGRGVGVDAYPLRTLERPWFASGLSVRSTGHRHRLARTQAHQRMEGHPAAMATTLERFRRDPGFTRDARGPVLSLLPAPALTGPQWGMVIDLGACTGCSTCVVACQAENNVPVVGRQEVLRGRAMHWLRIDRYLTGPDEDPQVLSQPMLCQHCEKAPCELVCPVNATVHSPDGLNEMVYNRCVGTRFCSNNCPYKVRRFNWFDYVDRSSRALQKNPEVTVRERGVMEKCTYCVQRIRVAAIEAEVEGGPAPAIETACQQVCPTRAIVFGDISDPASAVSQARRRSQRYEVLHDQGTRPRTQYLARIENPNPALHR